MAKQKGAITLLGTLNDLSFYDSVYGPMVRRKGGPSKAQIAQKPSCAPIRQSNNEFGACSSAGKQVRHNLHPLLNDINDHNLVWRVTQLMMRLKDCDPHSARGERSVARGLETAVGKELLAGFDFNSAAPLTDVLLKPYIFEPKKAMFILQLAPSKHLKYPQGAVQAVFKLAALELDLENKQLRPEVSPEVVLPLNRKEQEVTLQLKAIKKGPSHRIYLLKISFLGEDGKPVQMEKGSRNSLTVVGG